MDVFTIGNYGIHRDLEIENSEEGANPKRARFYSSIIDMNSLLKSVDYQKLPETCVIFFAEHDVLQQGQPIYHVNRTFSEYSLPFNDGSHIIYVNGEYSEDDAIGRLVHDFKCVYPEDMYYDQLKETVTYFKYTKEGEATVCKAVEEYGDRREKQGEEKGEKKGEKKGVAKAFSILEKLKAGASAEEIIAELHCTSEDVSAAQHILA